MSEKYQMGFPTAQSGNGTDADAAPETVNVRTSTVSGVEQAQHIADLEAKLRNAESNVELLKATLSACRVTFIAIMQATQRARTCSDNEIRFNITAAEVIAKDALKGL